MNVALLIKTNPAESHRPAEAIRIALGLIGGEHQVVVILMEKAALLLAEESDDLVDGEELEKYLPTLKELNPVFYVEETALEEARKEVSLVEHDCKIQAVSMEEISGLIAQTDRHLVF